jgi:DNA-binding beta-propeller fold protein YncE
MTRFRREGIEVHMKWLMVVGAAVLASTWAPVQAADTGGIAPRSTVTLPGAPLKGFDISWFDSSSDAYYLADRSNARIDVIDGRTRTYTRSIGAGQFVGATGNNDTSGPDGVLVAPGRHGEEVWAGDGNSTVKVFGRADGRMIATIPTGGVERADEMAFDPLDQVLLVANDADAPPFLTFISTRSHQVLGHLPMTHATGGLEQPVWDPLTRLFYLSVPEVDHVAGAGAIAVIDPRRERQVGSFPLTQCGPTGLTLGERQRLLVACGAAARTSAIDAISGRLLASVTQVGGADEAWYDPGHERFYVAGKDATGKAVVGVIDADSLAWRRNIPTYTGAHSVAADPRRGDVYVPLGAGAPQCAVPAKGCVAIFH